MSAFGISVVFFDLSVVFCMCFAKVCLGSNVDLVFLWFCPWGVLCC